MTSTRKQKYALPEQAEKADYVRRNFDEIAAHYDTFNDLISIGMHRLWKKATVKSLGVTDRTGVAVLDLCCGSGDLTMRLRNMLKEPSRIRALDFSANMLDILKGRLEGAPKRDIQVDVVRGDASDLKGIDDDSMDGVVISFGLRNVENRAACLSEMRRVLKPGARVAVLDVGKIKSPFVRFFHNFFFERVVPLIGYVLQGGRHEMYDYLPASSRVYPGQEELKAELEEAGFRDVSFRNFLFGSAVLHGAVK